MASQPASDPSRRGKTVYLLFNRPIFWLLDGQNRTRLKRSSCYLGLAMPPQHPKLSSRNHKDSYQSALFSFRNQELPFSLSNLSLKTQSPSRICEEALFVGPILAVENGKLHGCTPHIS